MREGKRGGGRSEGAHACNGWSLEVTWRPVPAISDSITHIVGMMVHCQVVVAPWDPAPDEADELIVSSSLVMRFHLGSQQGGVGANEGEAGHDKRSGNIKANGDDVGEKRGRWEKRSARLALGLSLVLVVVEVMQTLVRSKCSFMDAE